MSMAIAASAAHGQATSATATLSRLQSYQFGDVWRDGAETWVTASKLLNAGSYYIDPDGTKVPLHQLYALRLVANNLIEIPISQTYLQGSSPAHSALWVQAASPSTVEVFWNSKVSNGTYGMQGQRALLSKPLSSLVTMRVEFSAANWGWMPWLAADGYHHFSFAGYFEMLNTSSLGSITPAAFSAKWTAQRTAHSGSILPGSDAEVAARLCALHCPAAAAPPPPAPAPPAVPRSVVEYYVRGSNKYFITGRIDEQAVLDSIPGGFTRTGASFAATDAQYPTVGATSICRAYHDPAKGGTNTHFYGSPADCNMLQSLPNTAFTFEGYDFAVALPTNGNCPSGSPNPIYRLFRSNSPNHRYAYGQTLNATLGLNEGWVNDGVTFCATSAVSASPGLIPAPPPPPPAPPPPVAAGGVLSAPRCYANLPGAVAVDYVGVNPPAYIFIGAVPAGSTGYACATNTPESGSDTLIFNCEPQYMFPSGRTGLVYTWGAATRDISAPVTVGQKSAYLSCEIGTTPPPPPPPPAVPGQCGTANGTTRSTAPSLTSELCAVGTQSVVIGAGPWTWTCSGSNGGATASCAAQVTVVAPPPPPPAPPPPPPPPPAIAGVCGTANGTTRSSKPSTSSELCSVGSYSVVTGAGPWAWTCAGTNGGSTANCSAQLLTTPPPPPPPPPSPPSAAPGVCGAANGTSRTSIPTTASELCAVGTSAGATGTGPWTWSCSGINSGTPANCSAQLAMPTCNPAVEKC